MGKILGLDLGTTTMGISITDESEEFVYARETFFFHKGNYKAARECVRRYVEKEHISEIALGLPLMMSGDIGERAQSCLRFKDDLLKMMPDLIVHMVDERLSTVEANEWLLEADLSRKKRKKVIDKMAAVVILETFIRQKKEKK